MTSVFIMLIILGGIIYFFTNQLSDFSKDLPHLKEQFTTVFNNLQHWVSKTFNVKVDEQVDYINQGLNKLLSSSGAILGFTFGIFQQVWVYLIFHPVFYFYFKLQKTFE
jgi:predicted PurR-regulated permease PerM